jgi:hypothetical protein
MKQVKLFIAVFVCTIIVLSGCKKKADPEPEPEPAPDPYTYNAEVTSSKDISFATLIISDIEMMMGLVGENNFFGFYSNTSTSAGTCTVIRDTQAKYLIVAFNDAKCKDGRTRNGSIFLQYGQNGLGADYYRSYGFSGNISLSNYFVDGWLVEVNSPTVPVTIGNLVSSPNFDPAVTNLSWKFQGNLKLTHPTDPGRNIVWNGTLVKTLTNTSDPLVFSPTKTVSINWSKAKVNYTGTVTGTTNQSVSYNYLISTNDPLVREFSCSHVPAGTTGVTDFHPIIKGSSTFTTSNYHPRTINYGPQGACDNSGTVSFKGETYNVDFD